MVRERAQAFVMQGDSVLFNYRGQIAEMALRNRLPAASIQRELAEAGFLLTYGADIRDLYRRSAVFVDKIFKGAKPADLPVEQPTKFELVINLKTAKALGIIVPPSLLTPRRRGDRIISRLLARGRGTRRELERPRDGRRAPPRQHHGADRRPIADGITSSSRRGRWHGKLVTSPA